MTHMGTDDTEAKINHFVAFRKQYLKIGELLETNQTYYQKILQNQAEIKEMILKGWGY